MNEALTISVEDAARLLGISRGSAYQAARRGELPVIRLGRRLLIPRAQLYALVGDPSFSENGCNPEEVDDEAVRAEKGEAGVSAPARRRSM